MSNTETYTSISGVEIQAVFGNTKFGDLHMIKYATQRDVANIWTMGNVDAVSVAKGKRSTTGACVFAVFDKDRLLEAVKTTKKVFLSNHELLNYGSGYGTDATGPEAGAAARNAILNGGTVRDNSTFTSVFDRSNYGRSAAPALVDQIPPFDITLVGISESSGNASRMVIQGVQFNSDQGGTSVDDLTLERQLTFIAKRVVPWTNLDELSQGKSAGIVSV